MQKKKSLGQHFLKSEKAIRSILEAANLSKNDIVLEIGPGEGVLTEKLLEKAGKVIAIEKDDRLIEFLSEKFDKYIKSNSLEIVHKDALEFESSSQGLKTQSYKIVANLPYYITGHFIRKFLETECLPSSMTLLLQKEVASRIVASNQKESILSISVKAYGKPKYIETVKAGSFVPAPKVDSAILHIGEISKNFFTEFSEKRFFETVKKGFSQKRKKLIGNLDLDASILIQCGIEEKVRAEDLSVEEWRCLLLQIGNSC
ncbi:MAG: ribosomal RNA small subunit methyltransferase A [Parcubacteria group bacterium CG11_big_fil_rev_8_21_14_0_20_39_22]|nr:MAG: ribosomal RNA small subunit methyltransferase A [Parcubacteria group bacterium CG11_big_fil_rev_8_21_14_0_20_39_22]